MITARANQELYAKFRLPSIVVGRSEINKLYRESELLDNFLKQDTLRRPGMQPARPAQSFMLKQFCQLNGVNLLDYAQRQIIMGFLKDIKKNAPVIKISFATDAPSQFVDKLVSWLRQNIYPQLMVEVGYSPSIRAGCVVRTTNKVFDFGLKKRFEESKPMLLERIRTLG